jgi:hypothetical protein
LALDAEFSPKNQKPNRENADDLNRGRNVEMLRTFRVSDLSRGRDYSGQKKRRS